MYGQHIAQTPRISSLEQVPTQNWVSLWAHHKPSGLAHNPLTKKNSSSSTSGTQISDPEDKNHYETIIGPLLNSTWGGRVQAGRD